MEYPFKRGPLLEGESKVQPPPTFSDLLPEERALLSEKELLEALAEEGDEDSAFLLEYRAAQASLERERKRLAGKAFSNWSIPEKLRRSRGPRKRS